MDTIVTRTFFSIIIVAVAMMGCGAPTDIPANYTATTSPTTATTTPATPNTAPIAMVTSTQSGVVTGSVLPRGTQVQLTGVTSTDADGDTLTYGWTLLSKPAGSAQTLTTASTANISLTLDVAGEYVVQLIVKDGVAQSAPTTFKVIAAGHEMAMLNYKVIDAEYSEQMDRIIIVAADPAKLIILNPVTKATTEVSLPLNPTSVSVGPTGTDAAVGHNAYVSYVNLTTGALTATHSSANDVFDVVLAGNGYIYAFPRVDQWVNIHCIRVSDGQHSISTGYGSGYIYDETRAKLHPVQLTAIYGANNGLSPSDIEKYDISAGTASVLYDSPYHGEYSMCGNLWFSEDGARIFTACGNVFSATSSQTSDMYYVGALPDTARVASLDHSSETLKVVAIPGENLSDTTSDATVKIFASDFLTLQKTDALPMFVTTSGAFSANGKYIFLKSDGTQYYVIAKADAGSGLLNDYAIIISPAGI